MQRHRTTKLSQKLVVLEQTSSLQERPQHQRSSSVHTVLPSAGPLEQTPPLRRVVAYCTADEYCHLGAWTQSLQSAYPDLVCMYFDECTYLRFPERPSDEGSYRELFLLDFGVAVFWGWHPSEESSMLRRLQSSEHVALRPIKEELLHCLHDARRTPKIYNDIIVLNDQSHYMAKMTIAMGMAQSAKLAYYEDIMDEAIDASESIPHSMAKFGRVQMSQSDCLKSMGQLFSVRSEIYLSNPILDTPELFWSERSLLPLYEAVRSYMEISQRVQILNQRTQVLTDLLDMLNEFLTKRHGETLEWVVIWLIVISVCLAGTTIYLKLSRSVDGLI